MVPLCDIVVRVCDGMVYVRGERDEPECGLEWSDEDRGLVRVAWCGDGEWECWEDGEEWSWGVGE